MKKGKMIFIGIMTTIVLVLLVFQIRSGSTVELKHTIVIDAPKERVWEILNQLETVADYNPEVNKATCISDHRSGVGASRECTMNDGSSVKERVTDIEPGRAISMGLYESSWPVKDMHWRTEVKGEGNGTEVTQNLQHKVRYGALGALMNALMMKRKMNEVIQQTFEGLKNYAEK